MAVTTIQATGTRSYAVLRPICINGERVEVGERVDLTVSQAAELSSAGKVGAWVEKPQPSAPAKPIKTPTQEAAP